MVNLIKFTHAPVGTTSGELRNGCTYFHKDTLYNRYVYENNDWAAIPTANDYPNLIGYRETIPVYESQLNYFADTLQTPDGLPSDINVEDWVTRKMDRLIHKGVLDEQEEQYLEAVINTSRLDALVERIGEWPDSTFAINVLYDNLGIYKFQAVPLIVAHQYMYAFTEEEWFERKDELERPDHSPKHLPVDINGECFAEIEGERVRVKFLHAEDNGWLLVLALDTRQPHWVTNVTPIQDLRKLLKS